ncbi:glycerophosphodiester phosphodiesterase family protein [Lentilactobacillus sp. SPB1-3]|uniref:Glycerophosphodiester phosphodiesterase family protein n=1 Tax=Lentilactobacillus terminaliae TaxID=3003483 RepID=A0ACD5DCE5_9LACO|nr:glycerophosphodiester phosphodiesterase family protein [Lentilactobacillus sp. SPB1-3]MCZ0977405.1 glycerophosphodiester phosphodiesterase family protein [Lentilactobacillus sp. SPB1-3]
MSVNFKDKLELTSILLVAIVTNLIIGRVLNSPMVTFIIILISLLIQAGLVTSLRNKLDDRSSSYKNFGLYFISLILILPTGIMGIFTPLKMNIPVTGAMLTWLTINRRILILIGVIVYLAALFFLSTALHDAFRKNSGKSLFKEWLKLIFELFELVIGTFLIIFVMAGIARVFNGGLSLTLINAGIMVLVNYYQMRICLKIFGLSDVKQKVHNNWHVILTLGSCWLIVCGIQSTLKPLVTARNNDKIVVHRGVIDGNGEYNRISSLNKNGGKGYPFIEMDIQETKDHQFICQHDDTIDIQGKLQLVNSLTLKQIQKHKQTDLFGDYLKKAGKLRQKLIVELKATNISSKNMGFAFVKQFGKQMAQQHNMVHSIDYQYLMQIKSLQPRIKVGLVTMLNVFDITKLKPDFYTVQRVTMNDYLIAQCQSVGRPVFSWTNNSVMAMKTAKLLGVQGQVTDRASLLKHVDINQKKDAWLLILNKVWDYA